MTNSEWKWLEKACNSPFCNEELVIDGYNISLHAVRTGFLQYGLMVFVDGKITGEQLFDDNIRRRFFMKRKKSYMSKEELKKCGYRGKAIEIQFEKHRINYYHPVWHSFLKFKNNLKGNCTTIELSPRSRERMQKSARRTDG